MLTVRASPYVISLAVLLVGDLASASGQIHEENEPRNIFFNRSHYEAEQKEAQEKILRAAEKICPNHQRQLEKKIEDFKVCSARIDEDNATMCRVIQKNLKTCVKPMFDLFESCVPEKVKGLPTYVLETTEAVTKYVCDSDGAHLLELGNPCILRKNHPFSRSCIRKLKNEVLKYDFDDLPEKQIICRFLEDFKGCFHSHLENSCQDPTTREAYSGLYETLLCK